MCSSLHHVYKMFTSCSPEWDCITVFIDLDTVTLQPKVQATLHTRPSFHPEKWFIPFLSKPLRGCTLWNRCPSWGQPPGMGRKLGKTLHLVAFPAPPPFVFPCTAPACCCLATPLQLGTASQRSSSNVLSDFPQGCDGVSRASLYKHFALLVFLPLHWSCLFSWLFLICSISRCTWKPCLY